jgi:hypothetical protein
VFVSKLLRGKGFVRKSACWRPVGYVVNFDVSNFGDFSNKMVLDTYVFGSGMEYWILN